MLALNIVDEFSHRFGTEALGAKDLLDFVRKTCAADIRIEKGAGPAINEHFRAALSLSGWALDARVHPAYNLDVNALRDGTALTVQTGNITRAFYDLMKFQAMHIHGRADSAVLVLPTSAAASAIGSNVANFERVTSELRLFSNIIFIPVHLIAIG